jgi:hypothetical protein
MGKKAQDGVLAPSRAAAALQKLSCDSPEAFLRQLFNWKKQIQVDSGVDKEAAEDRKATQAALRKLEAAVEVDVDGLLKDAAVKFPSQFESTLKTLGWERSRERHPEVGTTQHLGAEADSPARVY